MDTNTKNKFRAMIINGAIGDQYGAPIEMMPSEMVLNRYTYDDLESYLITFKNEEPGKQYTYTDDTQMTLSVIDAIIQSQGNITMQLMLDSYLLFFQPFRGYCLSMYNLFEELYANGKNMTPEMALNLTDNGGIMRSSPLAILCLNKSYSDVLQCVNIIHYPTHQNKLAVEVSALYVWCLITFSKLETVNHESIINTYKLLYEMATEPLIIDKLKIIIDSSLMDEYEILDELIGLDAVECYESFACAMWCILKNLRDVKSIIKKALTYGGDTDTVCGLVGQLSGELYGFDAVKENWMDKLESLNYINSQCEKILAFDHSTLNI